MGISTNLNALRQSGGRMTFGAGAQLGSGQDHSRLLSLRDNLPPLSNPECGCGGSSLMSQQVNRGLPSGANFAPGDPLDLSRPSFRFTLLPATQMPDLPTAPSEALLAIPRVRPEHLSVDVDTGGQSIISATLWFNTTVVNNTPYYTSSTPPELLMAGYSGPDQPKFARAGFRFGPVLLDTKAGAPHSAGDLTENQLIMASSTMAWWLDRFIGDGYGMSLNGFVPLTKLATDYNRFSDDYADVDKAAIKALSMISTRASLTGEGADCLVGNNRMLVALMMTPAGSQGQSGFRYDPRTKRVVYHFMGVPFYRAAIVDHDENTGYLFALNLGPNGLNLLHATGSSDTLGMEVDPWPVNTENGSTNFLVHGAWTLMLWDPLAIYMMEGVTY